MHPPPAAVIGSGASVGGPSGGSAREPAAGVARPQEPYDAQALHRNLKEAVEHLNKQLLDSGRSLGFKMDEALSMPIVTVKNSRTGEVIRQIPSEAVVRVAHTLDELKGLLYDESS